MGIKIYPWKFMVKLKSFMKKYWYLSKNSINKSKVTLTSKTSSKHIEILHYSSPSFKWTYCRTTAPMFIIKSLDYYLMPPHNPITSYYFTHYPLRHMLGVFSAEIVPENSLTLHNINLMSSQNKIFSMSRASTRHHNRTAT